MLRFRFKLNKDCIYPSVPNLGVLQGPISKGELAGAQKPYKIFTVEPGAPSFVCLEPLYVLVEA